MGASLLALAKSIYYKTTYEIKRIEYCYIWLAVPKPGQNGYPNSGKIPGSRQNFWKFPRLNPKYKTALGPPCPILLTFTLKSR